MNNFRKFWQDVQIWRKANSRKELKEMPAGYLLLLFSMTTFVVTMVPMILVPATKLYLDAFEQSNVPWWWALVGVWLSAWWAIQVFALLISISHGRALSEKLFAPVVKKRPYCFEAKPPRRHRGHR